LRTSESTLEFLVKNVIEGKVIILGSRLPQVDPTLAPDFRIHNFTGLSVKECQLLLEKSGVLFSPHDESKLKSEIFRISNGNPFILRTVIAAPILESRELSHLDILESLPKIGSRYWTKVFSHLDGKQIQILTNASLIIYDLDFHSEIIQEIPRTDLQFLETCGVLSKHSGKFLVLDLARNYLMTCSDLSLDDVRTKLLDKLTIRTSRSSLKDKLNIQVELRDHSSAAATASLLVPLMYKAGEITDLIQLSNSIWKDLSIEALLERRKALILNNQIKQAHREMELMLNESKEFASSPNFLLAHARNFYSLGNFVRSLKIVDSVIEDSKPTALVHLEALIQKSIIQGTSQPEAASETLKNIESLIHSNQIHGSAIEARFYFSKGLLANEEGNYLKAFEFYDRSERLYTDLGLEAEVLNPFLSKVSALMDLGRIAEFNQELLKLKRISESQGNELVLDLALDLEAYNAFLFGDLQAATSLWKKISCRSGSLPSTKREIYFSVWLLFSKLFLGNIPEAQKLAAHLEEQEVIQRDAQRSSFVNFLRGTIGIFQNCSADSIYDLEVKILGSSIRDEFKAAALTILLKLRLEKSVVKHISDFVIDEIQKLKPTYWIDSILTSAASKLAQKTDQQTLKVYLFEKAKQLRLEVLPSEKASQGLELDFQAGLLKYQGFSKDLTDKPIALRFLQCLLESSPNRVSKEKLVNAVWTESYNPLIHDSRIYTNIKRLRATLGEMNLANAIISRDNEYQLNLELIRL